MKRSWVFRRLALPLAIALLAGLGASSPAMSQQPDVFNNNTPGGIPGGTAAGNYGCPGGGYVTERGHFVRCAGVKQDGIIRPRGWSRNHGTTEAQPGGDAGQRTNGYRGLSPDQARALEARNRGINDRFDVRAVNSMADAAGVHRYRAEPQKSNIGAKAGFRPYRASRNNYSRYTGRGGSNRR